MSAAAASCLVFSQSLPTLAASQNCCDSRERGAALTRLFVLYRINELFFLFLGSLTLYLLYCARLNSVFRHEILFKLLYLKLKNFSLNPAPRALRARYISSFFWSPPTHPCPYISRILDVTGSALASI